MASSLSNPYGPDRSSQEAKDIASEPSTAVDSAMGTNTSDKDKNGETDYLAYVAQAEDISREYQHRNVERSLTRSYRAWRNEHYEGSKYLSNSYKGRTRLFVPKTRSSIRKNMAATAAALFSTEDVVQIDAAYESDPIQRATADAIKADLNYRTTKSSKKSGFPWFQICMGANLDAQLTGVSCSKQYWEYEQVDSGETETKQEVDPDSGEILEFDEPIMKVVRDRPMVDLIPIENIMVDPSAAWYDPVQAGSWFCARYPMKLDDVRVMLKKKGPKDAWLEDVSDEVLLKGRIDEDRSTSRRSREGGDDRYEEFRQSGGWTTVWINENFMRIDGIDYHFWSVGRHGMLSEVREVHESYPALHGERPYVFGVSQIDSHKVFPMSPAESWQPLQQEINDVTNLRLDTLKRSIAPLAKVKRGRNVDMTQLQRRGRPDAILQVDAMEDVEIESTPGPSGASYTETSVANSNFDELAGSFSSSTVQQSRQINETVGGMKLMSGSANAVTEFDLRVWSETYIEPCFRQLVNLIIYYESDEKLMALVGEKARTRQKHGYEPTIDDLLEAEVSLSINAGIGALDPMQKLAKFKGSMEMLMPLYPVMQQQGVTPNIEEMVSEVMGSAGFSDGKRFFNFDEQPQPDGAQEAEKAKIQGEQMAKMQELQLKQKELEFKYAKIQMDNETKVRIEEMGNQTDLEEKRMGVKVEGAKVHASAMTDRARRQEEFQMKNYQDRVQNAHQGEITRMQVQAKPTPSQGSGGGSSSSAPIPRQQQVTPYRAPQEVGEATVMAGVNGQLEKILSQNQASIAQNNQLIAQALNSIAQVAQQLTKPKRVVRDSSGKVVGVE